MARKRTTRKAATQTETYQHPTASSLMRPEVGTQAQFENPGHRPPTASTIEPRMSSWIFSTMPRMRPKRRP